MEKLLILSENLICNPGLAYVVFCAKGLGYVLLCFPDDFTKELVTYYQDHIYFSVPPEALRCFDHPYGTIVEGYLPYYDLAMVLKDYPITMVCLPEGSQHMIASGFLPDLSNAERFQLPNFIELSDPKSLNPLGFTPYVKVSSTLSQYYTQ
jgi:hypothetical protein